MSHLDARQQSALAQFQQLTNATDEDVAIGVLESVEWDVQKAVELVFGSAAPQPSQPLSRPTTIQPLEIDDSTSLYPPRPIQRRQNQQHQPSVLSYVFQFARPIFSVLAFPIHLFSHIIRFVFGILRIPLPQLNFSALSFYRPLPRNRPPASRGGPDRWVRELEEETGAVCIGRATPAVVGTTTATDAAGSSSLMSRARGATEGPRYLPDFTLGTYEQFLRTCQKEIKIGCIVLVSEEHDDVPEFKRATLTDPDFVNLLQTNNIIVWGGDVREREAWSAAEKLQATTYPFVAFVAPQPRRNIGPPNSRSSDSAPVLTVLSRHQGPPSGPTSASTLSNHLTTQLLPRVTPYLERARVTLRERERDRLLREEQDRAFAEAARKDKERIEEKMAQERRVKEQARLDAEAEQRRLADIEEQKKKAEVRMEWRRWIRRKSPLILEGKPGNGVRVAIRLPDGSRAMKTFDGTQQTLTSLYLFVDAHLVPDHFPLEDDPQIPPSNTYHEVNDQASLVACVEKQIDGAGSSWWGFQLALAYPRKEIQWERGVKIADVQSLTGGAQLVVELTNKLANGNGTAKGKARATVEETEEDDGYHTEESDDGA